MTVAQDRMAVGALLPQGAEPTAPPLCQVLLDT